MVCKEKPRSWARSTNHAVDFSRWPISKRRYCDQFLFCITSRLACAVTTRRPTPSDSDPRANSTKPGPLPLLPFHCAARDPAASERCSSALPVPHTLPPSPLVPLSPHSLSPTSPTLLCPQIPQAVVPRHRTDNLPALPPRVVGPAMTEETCVTGGCYLFGKS